MSIKVSVILPSLNVAEYIRETFESALCQTLTDIEIICVDAGSTDGTLDIINEYASKDARIRLLMSTKKSYGYQVNLGIESACGEYIAILETDDFIEPDMYQKLYESAKQNSVDYIKADYDVFFSQDDGSYYYFSRRSFSDADMYDRVLCPKEYSSIGRDDWYLWQGIYSLDYIKRNSIRFNESPGAAFQDIGFLFWSGVYAEKAMYLPDRLYHYRIDRDGASSNSGKNLTYAFTEYSCVKGKLESSSTTDDRVYKMLYARMIKSFVSAYAHISESVSAQNDRRSIYEWFRQEIQNAFEKGLVSDENILSGHLERLKYLLKSEKEYFSHYSDMEFEHETEMAACFAIFGCGDFGFRAYNRLKAKDKRVISFFDNNTDLWGKSINGVSIDNPENAIKLADDCCIIIANEAYHADIKEQLIKMGIEEKRLIVFR